MRDIDQFIKEWNEAKEGGYEDLEIIMYGSWDDNHKEEAHYLHENRMVRYEIIGSDMVKLIAENKTFLIVPVSRILQIV